LFDEILINLDVSKPQCSTFSKTAIQLSPECPTNRRSPNTARAPEAGTELRRDSIALVERFSYRGIVWALCLVAGLLVAARSAPASDKPRQLDLQYRLTLTQPSVHIMDVEIDVTKATGRQLDFAMPAWAPGRYAIYNFSKNVQQFSATTSTGVPVPWAQTDKQTWRVNTSGGGAIRVRYRVYGNDLTGSFSQFDSTHANIDGGCVFMYIRGHKADPITLTVQPPAEWGPAVPIYSGFSDSPAERTFHAANYDLLVDTPMEIAPNLHVEQFQNGGKLFRVVVHSMEEPAGSKAGWMQPLTDGIQKVVKSEMAGMPEPDFSTYTFLIHFSPFIEYGDGMEHLNSTQVIVHGEAAASVNEALETVAHEFFHLWNVKRIRPAGLGPFDYTKEVYTPSLWFAEGVTSYFSYLGLLRAGIWNQDQFLKRLAAEARELRDEPGRKLMSAERSSLDAWYFDRSPQMQQTNFANTTISYYNKGALLGLLLDLEVRSRTHGGKTLRDVMNLLYQRFYLSPAATYYLRGKGYTEKDLIDAFNSVTDSDFTGFFARYVQGTDPLPYSATLGLAGMQLQTSVKPNTPPALGVLFDETEVGVEVRAVLHGGAAERAGISRGDVLTAVDGLSLASQSLQSRLRIYPAGAKVPVTLVRLGEEKTVWVTLDPPLPNDFQIVPSDNATPDQLKIRNAWLNGIAGKVM
jgi:predicted metalloprotease with PDZ domain